LSTLVIIVYFQLFSGTHGERGAVLPLFFQKGSNGCGANFSSQYHREFHEKQDLLVEANILQLLTHPQYSELFSTPYSVIIFEVNTVAEQKQTY